eukprot:726653-Amphidinium_carterae.2
MRSARSWYNGGGCKGFMDCHKACEVSLFRMQGQIEQQKLQGELLEIQHDCSACCRRAHKGNCLST